jgi:hypothetical protein
MCAAFHGVHPEAVEEGLYSNWLAACSDAMGETGLGVQGVSYQFL